MSLYEVFPSSYGSGVMYSGAEDDMDTVMAAAQPLGPVQSNYDYPDEMVPTPPYAVAAESQIAADPWMGQFQVSGIAGLADPRKWGPGDLRNARHPHGVYPQVGRAPNVPLRQDALPPEAINPKARTITQREMRGNNFHASRRDMSGLLANEDIREHVRVWDPAGTYGCKNSMQPGAEYAVDADVRRAAGTAAGAAAPTNSGWATGLQMIQRPTNKDPSRLRLQEREMTYRVTFAEGAPRRTTTIGYALETMRGGSIGRPKNEHVSNYFRPPVPDTTAGGVRALAPVYAPHRGQYTQTHRSTLAEVGPGGGGFAAAFAAGGGVNMAPPADGGGLAPEPSAAAGDWSYSARGAAVRASLPTQNPVQTACLEAEAPGSVWTGAVVDCIVPAGPADGHGVRGNGETPTWASIGAQHGQPPMADPEAGYFGAPHANVRTGPALRPAASAGHFRSRRSRKTDRTAESAASHVPAGHTHRASTIDRDQQLGPLTHRDGQASAAHGSFRFGPLHIDHGAPGYEATFCPSNGCFDGSRMAGNNLRDTRRQEASFAGNDLSRALMHTRVLSGANRLTYGTLFKSADNKKSPIIIQEPDALLLSSFLNNPYRNQPVSDGKGNWIPIQPAPATMGPDAFYRGIGPHNCPA